MRDEDVQYAAKVLRRKKSILFLIIWSAAFFLPWKRLMDFFPEDIKDKAIEHKPPFESASVIGWICLILGIIGLACVIIYGGWEGYHSFGFNRKEQIRQIIMLPFVVLLTAWICSLF